jgi:hypothetical protein
MMEENETEEFFYLDPDESQHYKQLSDEIMRNIDLAENAAKITLNGFSSI